MNEKVAVVGIGDDGRTVFSEETRHIVDEADVLYGSQRQLGFFQGFQGDRKLLQSPLSNTLDEIKRDVQTRNVVVLASGDPLFYGIGGALVKRFGREQVAIYPHVSSIQLAFAKAGLAWHDATIISLHGKPIAGLAQRLHGRGKVVLLTDNINTPQAIAKYLLAYEMTEYDAFVAEHLGGKDERAAWYSLDDMADGSFYDLNVVILTWKQGVTAVFHLGMEDDAFSQRKPDRGLITKREVRVQTLSELRLEAGDVFWDIGACTGSVSIEAILSTPSLQVFAVEKNEADLANLRENQVRFRTDFTAIHAKAPDGLSDFPNPNAVFIGGCGGELSELLKLCAHRLHDNGRIVVNAATIENLYHAYETLRELNFSVTVTLLQTARSKPILNLTRFEGMNPVYLVTGIKTRADEEVEK